MTGSESLGSPRSTARGQQGQSQAVSGRRTDILDNIVAESILDELDGVGRDSLDQLNSLDARSMIDASLQDAATVSVSADGDAVLANCVEDKLSILGLEAVQALLDDVVSVEVLNQLDNLALKCLDDSLDLAGVSGAMVE